MIVRCDMADVFRIAICEDDKEMLQQLQTELHKLPELESTVIQTYESGKQLLDSLTGQEPKAADGQRLVVFSDIEMPELDGVTFGKRLHEQLPDSILVFVTSHSEYAIAGYEADAFRYLLKPVSSEQLRTVIREIKREWNRHPCLLLQLSDAERILRLEDILYLSAEDKYTMLYTRDGRLIERTSLQEFEQLLEEYGFCRIHRKYLVNLYHHRQYEKGTLELSNGQLLPVSRRREAVYREMLMKKLEKELIS